MLIASTRRVSAVSFATVNPDCEGGEAEGGGTAKSKGQRAIFFVLRVSVMRPKEKQSTADDEGYGALSKYMSFFLRPEHPAARARALSPLCISMHRGGHSSFRARVYVSAGARAHVSPVIAQHACTRCVVRFSCAQRHTGYKYGAAPNDLSRASIDYEISRGHTVDRYCQFQKTAPRHPLHTSNLGARVEVNSQIRDVSLYVKRDREI